MSAYPATYSAYRRSPGTSAPPGGRITISLSTESLPQSSALKSDDVIIKVHAISLNYRDLGMLIGNYPAPFESGGIPCSDAAGEVVAVGNGVSKLAVGDRVMPITCIGDREGEEDDDGTDVNIGTDVTGVLSEYMVVKEKHLVVVPENMGWEEASTLPCASLAAYNALGKLQHVPKHASALLQGTGGVSMFALLFCIAAGIRPIITSSSDAKISEISKLHPSILGINYKTLGGDAAVAAEVKRLTNGRGVDFVVNNSGPGSLMHDIDMLCDRDGTISLVGFLGGFGADWPQARIMGLMAKRAKLQGISMGSKKDFEEMNAFIQNKKIDLKPLLVKPFFKFEEAQKAYDKLESGDFIGKIVIKVI
ncbi:GroES-like protein [Periconia macrospinosa]|uniref:GroES-like protein n=1 Tax=Periconia macrospinosa TaxID=97972 RepID=A0A2V1DLB7_9PLEO|nr:GroES-like protein [Periconia macrospinosa]